MRKDYWETLTREEAVAMYRLELEEAAEDCEERYGHSNGSNYELMAESIRSWWHEQYPQWF